MYCDAFAEALAEALYLFQTPSALKPAEKLAQHCLLFSLTEAHNMAVGWPHPLPGAENQASALHICLTVQSHRNMCRGVTYVPELAGFVHTAL